MKKLILLLTFITTLTFAQIVSHPVGYTSTLLEPYRLYFLGMSYENTNMYADIVAQLPTNSVISTWNKSAKVYEQGRIENHSSPTGTISRGDGFFVSVPETTRLFLFGKVPVSTNFVKEISKGLTMTGLPYPTIFNVMSNSLSRDLKSGSIIMTWNPEIQRYTVYKKKGSDWNSNDIVIYPDEGFWIKQKGDETLWETEKPYIWP
jgi:hypothetical protein